jgi:predicted amidophosphoribosyltransferase
MKTNALYGGFFAFLPRVKTFLLETVFPEHAVCRACGKISEGGVLCRECENRLRSDGMVDAWDREDLEPDLPAYTLRPHTGVARQLVLRLKHSAEKCVADELADLILPVPGHISFPPDTVVTWVPMPESRRRERCIDHGRTLAEAAASRLHLSCRALLIRRDTRDKPQATLGQKDREANLIDAFRPAETIDFPVLLVDDVLTTGTTSRRCADALRQGGARDITVLAFTRALGHS